MNRQTFTAQHKLKYAVEEYMEAIYRFRRAEFNMSDDYSEARREMNRLEQQLLWTRYCIYSNSTHLLLDVHPQKSQSMRCPSPTWNRQIV